MLSSEERERLLFEWNQTATPYPRERCIHEEFEERARQSPMAAAVAFEGKTISYGELNRKANQLAAYLRERGVKVGASRRDLYGALCGDDYRNPWNIEGWRSLCSAGSKLSKGSAELHDQGCKGSVW